MNLFSKILSAILIANSFLAVAMEYNGYEFETDGFEDYLQELEYEELLEQFDYQSLMDDSDDELIKPSLSTFDKTPTTIIQDLNSIAKTSFVTIADFLQHIEDNDSEILRPLKEGRELFEAADRVESLAKQSGHVVWWRAVTRTPDNDVKRISKHGKSFAVSLLAGYMKDGYSSYGQSVRLKSNVSACTYIYYANARFAQTLFTEQNRCIDDLKDFIKKNNFKINEKLIQRLQGIQDNKIPDPAAANTIILNIIISIQKLKNFNMDEHLMTVESLYARKNQFFFGQPDYIQQVIDTYVYGLLLPKAIAEKFLSKTNNRFVSHGLSAVHHGRGEEFHPKLSHIDLIGLDENVVILYQNKQVESLDQLEIKTMEIISRNQ